MTVNDIYETAFIILLCFISVIGSAQVIITSLLSSAGGTITSKQNSLDFSVGEPINAPFQSGDMIITQGFHQPDDKSTTSVPTTYRNGDIHVYPNPIFDRLSISLETEKPKPVNIQISNATGLLVYKGQIEVSQYPQDIMISDFPPGQYFLGIYGHDQQSHIFQISKN